MNLGNIITLLGGLGAFLFGMKYMGEGLELAAGSKMKDVLEKLTRNPVLGFLLGLIVTACIQSSSATTVMVMGFINAGIMDLAQATGVIFGANIGTTITSILIALDVSGIAPFCIAVGAVMMLYSKKKRNRHIGQVVLGFGFLFQGLHTMSGAMSPLRDSVVFQKFIMNAKNPFLGLLLGIVLCAIIQSSSASVGILQALAMQGLMPLYFAGFIVCGINVGSSTPVILSSFGAKNNAKRAASIFLLFNFVGAVLFMVLTIFTPLTDMIIKFVPKPAFQVSVYHILFKVVTGLILLPMTNLVVKLTYKIFPKQAHESAFRLEYIDKNMVGNPSVIIVQISKEVERVGELVKNNLAIACKGLIEHDLSTANEIRENEEVVDYLTNEITTYITKVNGMRLPVGAAGKLSNAFKAMNELEQIGDHAVKILLQNEKCVDLKPTYSSEAVEEFRLIYEQDDLLFSESMKKLLGGENTITEEQARETQLVISEMSAEAQSNHMDRLRDGKCSFDQGLTFVESLNSLSRIANHLTCIAEVGEEGLNDY